MGHGREVRPLLVSCGGIRACWAPKQGRYHCLAGCTSFQMRLDLCQAIWAYPESSRIFWDLRGASGDCCVHGGIDVRMGRARGAPVEQLWGAHLVHVRGTHIGLSIGAPVHCTSVAGCAATRPRASAHGHSMGLLMGHLALA